MDGVFVAFKKNSDNRRKKNQHQKEKKKNKRQTRPYTLTIDRQ